MSRLIDADELKNHYSWWNNEEKELFDSIVDAQPTAYDVNRVCAEIIEEANNTIVDFAKDKYVYTNKAINIVRKCGVHG